MLTDRACINCGENDFAEDFRNGHTVCRKCGVCVPEPLIDDQHEDKRTFGADQSTAGRRDDNARTSREQPFGIGGVATSLIVDNDVDEEGKQVARLHSNTIGYQDQRLMHGMSQIDRICGQLKISDAIKQNAKSILKDFEKSRKRYSRTGDKSMIVAIVYTACKDSNKARSFKDLAQATDTSVKQITKCYKKLLKLRKEKEDEDSSPEDGPVNTTSASALLPRILNDLKIRDYKYERLARKVAETATPYLEGRQPSSIAAASLLFVIENTPDLSSSKQIQDKNIADACSINVSTMRRAYRILEEHTDELKKCLKLE